MVGDEPVLVVFGDCLYDSKISTVRQIIDAYAKYESSIVGLAEVDPDQVDKFGVIEGDKIEDDICKIKSIVEKPKKETAPSNLAAVGKYVITPDVFEVLKNMNYDNVHEIGLTDAFNTLLNKEMPIYGKKLQGEWLDTGDKLDLIKATIKLGLKNKEIGENLRKFIQEIANK